MLEEYGYTEEQTKAVVHNVVDRMVMNGPGLPSPEELGAIIRCAARCACIVGRAGDVGTLQAFADAITRELAPQGDPVGIFGAMQGAMIGAMKAEEERLLMYGSAKPQDSRPAPRAGGVPWYARFCGRGPAGRARRQPDQVRGHTPRRHRPQRVR